MSSLEHSLTYYPASKPPPNPNFDQKPMASILKAGLEKPAAKPAPLPVRYAAAAAAAVAPSNAALTASHTPTQASATASSSSSIAPSASTALSISPSATTATDQASLSPSLSHPSLMSPVVSSTASTSAAPIDGSSYDSPAFSEAVPSGPSAASSPQRIRAGQWFIIICNSQSHIISTRRFTYRSIATDFDGEDFRRHFIATIVHSCIYYSYKRTSRKIFHHYQRTGE